jgi:hypothetical protein
LAKSAHEIPKKFGSQRQRPCIDLAQVIMLKCVATRAHWLVDLPIGEG